MTNYDPTNIFARILRGELPCHKVYDDENCLAFMDVMPQADGHTLVVPRSPSRNLLDADPAVLGRLMIVVQRIAKAAVPAFGADGVLIKQYNEAAAGQTVFHLHFHVVPRKQDVELRPHGGKMADNALLASHAEALRQALSKLA